MLHVVPMFFYNWLRKPNDDRDGSASTSLENILASAAQQLRDLDETDDKLGTEETTVWKSEVNKPYATTTTRPYEPMRKVPFVSLEINLDDTERSSSSDEDEEEEIFIEYISRRERSDSISRNSVEGKSPESLADKDSLLYDEEEIVRNSSFLELLSLSKELPASPAVVDLVARVSEESPVSSSSEEEGGRAPTTSSPAGSPMSGEQAPVLLHRTPVPSEIYCSLSNRNGDCEDDNDDVHADEIMDPTDALIYGWIHNPYLRHVAEKMNDYLSATEEDDDDVTHLCHHIALLIHQHPMACQVKYKPPEFDSFCYPLSYFAAAGWLDGCRAAYQAFPEAIGQEQDSKIGLPLHYACLHQANFDVVAYLVEKYSEATRVTNAEHQTPLHQACRSKTARLDVVELLLKHYPTAAQLADLSGYTPLHLAIRYGASLDVLAALQSSSPTVIRVVTLSWHRPLHIAALYNAPLETMKWLVQRDPSAVRATGEDFSTVLHYAVMGQCTVDVISFLRDIRPLSLGLTNERDETPYDVALRVPGTAAAVLDLLRPQTKIQTPQ